MSSKSSAPCRPIADSSSAALPTQRPKSLRLHESKILAAHDRNSAPTQDSDAPDSCHRIATRLLRQSRNELAITQERAAAIIERNPTSLGQRERGAVDLGPLRDWVKLVREIVRTKGPEAAAEFLTAFVAAMAERDSKK